MSGLTPFGLGVTRRLISAADIFSERAAVYKDNYKAVGRVMEALFPDGHTQRTRDDHNRWHLFELIIVKLTRYAQNYDTGGHEDSADDSIVYWAMLAQLDAQEAEQASEHASEPPTTEQPNSAVLSHIQADAEGWQMHAVVRTQGRLTMVEYGPNRVVLKVGRLVRFKQHRGKGEPVRIVELDPNREDGMSVLVENTQEGRSDGLWVHPAWLEPTGEEDEPRVGED